MCTEKSRHVLNKKLTAENRQRMQGKLKNPMKIEKKQKNNENSENCENRERKTKEI